MSFDRNNSDGLGQTDILPGADGTVSVRTVFRH